MGQLASPEEIRQLTRYSYAHLAACLPFVALGGFGVIPPWVFAAVSVPLGAAVGAYTLRPRRAGVLAGVAGMGVAGLLSGVFWAAGVVLAPRVFRDPRWTVGLAAGAVVGCLVGWYVWDVVRGPQSQVGTPPQDSETSATDDGEGR